MSSCDAYFSTDAAGAAMTTTPEASEASAASAASPARGLALQQPQRVAKPMQMEMMPRPAGRKPKAYV